MPVQSPAAMIEPIELRLIAAHHLWLIVLLSLHASYMLEPLILRPFHLLCRPHLQSSSWAACHHSSVVRETEPTP